MPNRLPAFYWDTNIFLAWLKDEERSPGEMAGLHSVVKEVYENKRSVMTSVLTQTEVLESSIGEEAYAKFQGFLKRSNVTTVNVDGRIATLAAQIRDHYRNNGKKIKTPDATHLATAILYKAMVFHTFDGDDLIPLNGNVMGHKLKIEKPSSTQLGLDFPRKQ